MSKLTLPIDYKSLEEELREALRADELYKLQNDAKLRAVEQNVPTYEDFRQMVMMRPLPISFLIGQESNLSRTKSITRWMLLTWSLCNALILHLKRKDLGILLPIMTIQIQQWHLTRAEISWKINHPTCTTNFYGSGRQARDTERNLIIWKV